MTISDGSNHYEQIREDILPVYKQAAIDVGGMALIKVAGPGQMFAHDGPNGPRQVEEGYVGVIVDKYAGSGGNDITPFGDRVREILAEQDQQTKPD